VRMQAVRQKLLTWIHDARPAVRHGAAWGLRYATTGASLGQLAYVQGVVARVNNSWATPDSGTRRYLTEISGDITLSAIGNLSRKFSSVDRKKAAVVYQQGVAEMWRTEGDSDNVAEMAMWVDGSIVKAAKNNPILKKDGQLLLERLKWRSRYDRKARPTVAFAAGVKSGEVKATADGHFSGGIVNTYKLTPALSADSLKKKSGAIFDRIKQETPSGVNLALNPNRIGKPKISADTPGWGFGDSATPQDMADGSQGKDKFDSQRGDINWQTGFAYPGGKNGWGGMGEGWHQFTVDFDEARMINALKIVSHGIENTPTKFRVVVKYNGKWYEAYKVQDNKICVNNDVGRAQMNQDGTCTIPVEFDEVPATAVRVEFQDKGTDHAWIEEVSVFYNLEPAAQATP
ncbi:MAG: hypothetical protein AABZ44_06295, partial [Elusimicrobiota bacterium]